MKLRLFTILIVLTLPMVLIGTIGGQTTAIAAAEVTTGTTTRVSVASDGTQGNNASWNSSISADGRYVAFYSSASSLVSSDTNNTDDIFVHDRQMGQTQRISVASDGTQGNGSSSRPSISADGRYVAFMSGASNLVSGDTNNTDDIFVHDRQMGQTQRISVASDGTQANNGSWYPSISANGDYVAFQSYASNLVNGDTNNSWDVFIYNRQMEQTSRISVASDGTQGNSRSEHSSISADGRYVAFGSLASNLVPGDTNGAWDVFVYDRQEGQTQRVSVASDRTQGNNGSGSHSISADGRYVAFRSSASNLIDSDTNGYEDIFVHDRQMGETQRVSVASGGTQGNNASQYPSISTDGRYVTFHSLASNLVGGDTNGYRDVFVHDRQMGETQRISVSSGGIQGNNASALPSTSADGRYVAFHSNASNLVAGDTNNVQDIFVHDRSESSVPAAIADLQARSGPSSGQIRLTWTAPHGVTPAMHYRARYAGSPIESELGWTSATAASGAPTPGSAGTTQSMTVTGLTPGQMYYFSIRVEYEADNLSALSNSPSAAATNAPDLLFRPNPDGFQFTNPGFMQPSCSDFQRSYSGLNIQCANGQPQQEYRALFANYRDVFSTGICTGMATSSLLYYAGTEPRPQPGTTFALGFEQARNHVAMYHGRQHSRAALDIVVPAWNSWRGGASVISQRVDAVYNQIEASLSPENNDPLILNLYPRPDCGASGHTVVPYRLDTSDPLRPKVYVYENFNPGDASKFIQFDFSTSIHRFSYWLWDSASCGALVAVPVSAFTSSGGQVPGTQLQVSTGGNVEPLLVNSTGSMVGYNNGELTATVTDATPVFPWYAPGAASTVTSFLMPPDTYTTTLNTSGGGYTFTAWSPSGTLALYRSEQTRPFASDMLSTNRKDYISFGDDLRSAILATNAGQQQPITLKLSVPNTDHSKVYTLDNVELASGGDLTVNVADSELTLDSKGLTTDYNVYFDRISTQTLSAFAHANLTISANDIHIITFSDGEDALLQIDHDGDGSIDETVILQNQAGIASHSIYLPVLIGP